MAEVQRCECETCTTKVERISADIRRTTAALQTGNEAQFLRHNQNGDECDCDPCQEFYVKQMKARQANLPPIDDRSNP